MSTARAGKPARAGIAGSGREAATGLVAGIDIGGTKIAVLIVDADGVVRGRATHAASVGDQQRAAAAIAAALDEALAAAGLNAKTSTRSASASPGGSTPSRAT